MLLLEHVSDFVSATIGIGIILARPSFSSSIARPGVACSMAISRFSWPSQRVFPAVFHIHSVFSIYCTTLTVENGPSALWVLAKLFLFPSPLLLLLHYRFMYEKITVEVL